MTLIEKPVAGQPMRAGWGASVAERLNQLGPFGVPGMLMRDGPFGQGSAPLPRNQRDRRASTKPLPFEVRWSATEADGAWVMWLPDKARCVSVAGAYVTPTGITAADDLPAGWYTIDNADAQSTAVYLVVTTDDSTGATTAEIDTTPGTASTGETVTNILIASLASDSQTGATRVRPFVVGALVLTPGGEETPPQPFEYVETQEEGEGGEQRTVKSIVNLDFYWDGAPETATLAPEFEVPANGNVFLCCAGTPSQSASAVHGYEWSFTVATSEASAPQDGKVANYKLYTFSNGEMTMDWRATFLALSSNTFAEPDNLSIDATGGTSHQQLQIKGYAGATIGMAPVKRQNGIVWEIVPLLTTATPPAECVLSTGAAAIGSSNEAARADHVHKLPSTVVDTTNNQTIGGTKTFSDYLRVASGHILIFRGTDIPALEFRTSDGTAVTSRIVEAAEGRIEIISPGHARLSVAPLSVGAEGYHGLQIATTGWTIGLQKTFVAGDGIAFSVSADGKTITISATNPGGATSGYTGARNTLAEQRYDTSNHQFQVKYHHETWVNGVMTACTTDTTWTTITGGQAVEETV